MSTYTINCWGSHPDAGNDDNFIGEDNVHESEISERVDSYLCAKDGYCRGTHIAYVEVVNSETGNRQNLIKNPNFKFPHADTSDEWRNEHRMQSAMAFGPAGWNDN